jgi:hypothetical protein
VANINNSTTWLTKSTGSLVGGELPLGHGKVMELVMTALHHDTHEPEAPDLGDLLGFSAGDSEFDPVRQVLSPAHLCQLVRMRGNHAPDGVERSAFADDRDLRSLKMNTWSRHSVLTDLTQRSAMALTRGDLNGVRTWAMQYCAPDDGMWHHNSRLDHEREIVAACDPGNFYLFGCGVYEPKRHLGARAKTGVSQRYDRSRLLKVSNTRGFGLGRQRPSTMLPLGFSRWRQGTPTHSPAARY